MLDVARICFTAALAWAALALGCQLLAARGGGRRDHSRPAGTRRGGIVHAFTTAMWPAHKESARLHPREFAVGVLLHAGVLVALAEALLAAAAPSAAAPFAPWPALAVAPALAAAALLAARRARSPVLRAMSSPDDFVAVGSVAGLLALALAFELGLAGPTPLLAGAALLLVYLPLGKLRHALFFFVARADYGARLGHRGVYPPAPTEAPRVARG